MRIEVDREADAAYIRLSDVALEPGRQTFELDTPAGIAGTVTMDWKDGKIVGLEVVGASALLPDDLLARAVISEES